MWQKSRLPRKIKQRFDKKQGCLEKIEQRYNKNQVSLEEIEVRNDKNQGYQEKLNKDMTKTMIGKKN